MCEVKGEGAVCGDSLGRRGGQGEGIVHCPQTFTAYRESTAPCSRMVRA